MSLIKFKTDDKIRIYSAYVDNEDSETLIRNLDIKEFMETWTFERNRSDYDRVHFTEKDQKEHTLNRFNYYKIYYDKSDYIFDMLLISSDISFEIFTEYFIDSLDEYLIKYTNLRIEHLIYQDVGGDTTQRKLISRKIINDPDNPSNNGINSMCKQCSGTGKIVLFYSTEDCECST